MIKNSLKKILLKFPFLYRPLFNLHKRLKGIDPRADGVAGEELDFLLKSFGKGNFIMEIGVFSGETTKRLAKNNFVIAIDPFIPEKETGTLQGEYSKDVYQRFITNTMGKKIMFFPLTSKDAFMFWDKYIKKKNIDAIFVDGLHKYPAVIIDFEWRKYLKKGGIIAFHDTDMPEVKKFIDEKMKNNPKYKLLGAVNSLKVFRKLKD